MTPTDRPPDHAQSLLVSILRQGPYLIASIHTALDDSELLRFQRDLIARVGRDRARGVIIDVAALDVLDSFAANTLSTLARMTALRGAATVIVGISPEIAYSMVQLGLRLDAVPTALDLDEGLSELARLTGTGHGRPAGRGQGSASGPTRPPR
jgi:rsbT antagonist protein RsbS